MTLPGALTAPMSPQPIQVIGGGLAGLSLGVELRRLGIPVTLIEASAYPRHRLCGEFLHGRGEALLALLGIVLPPEVPSHQKIVWMGGAGSRVEQVLDQPVRGLSRHGLDALLARRFRELGGQLEHRRAAAEELVPAAGRVLATGRRRQRSPWFGIKLHLRGLELQAGLEMHLGRRGYLGLTAVEGGWINACGLFRVAATCRVPAAERLPALLEGADLHPLAARVRAAEIRAGSICGVAGLRLGRQRQGQGAGQAAAALSLGDARFCPAPLSGNGQSMALEAGVLAAGPLAHWSRGDADWPATVVAVRQLLTRRQNARGRWGLCLHHLVLAAPGRSLMIAAARRRLLPLTMLARLVAG